MRTICKFNCWSVQESKNHKGEKEAEYIKLGAATANYEKKDDPALDENSHFWKYTPSGTFDVEITNPNVFGMFKPGLDYYMEISLVPKELQTNPIVAEESGAFDEAA